MRAVAWLTAWRWALAYNARRNVRLIRRYGLLPVLLDAPHPRHAGVGRARRRRGPAEHRGPLYSVATVLRLAGAAPLAA